MPEERKQRPIPIIVTGLDENPILFANHFVVQHHMTEFIITFGQVQPPIILGSPEQQAQQAEHISSIPARVVARIGLTPQRMTELVRVMQENLSNYEQQRGTR